MSRSTWNLLFSSKQCVCLGATTRSEEVIGRRGDLFGNAPMTATVLAAGARPARMRVDTPL